MTDLITQDAPVLSVVFIHFISIFLSSMCVYEAGALSTRDKLHFPAVAHAPWRPTRVEARPFILSQTDLQCRLSLKLLIKPHFPALCKKGSTRTAKLNSAFTGQHQSVLFPVV